MTDPDRVLCPDCGTDNEAPARFCGYCGTMLLRPWSLESEPELSGAGMAPRVAASAAGGPNQSGTVPSAPSAPRAVAGPLEFSSPGEAREFQELISRSGRPDANPLHSEWADPRFAVPAASAPAPTPRIPERSITGPAGPAPAPVVQPSPPVAVEKAAPGGNPAPPLEPAPVCPEPPSGDGRRRNRAASLLRPVALIASAALLTGMVGYAAAVTLIKPGDSDRLISGPESLTLPGSAAKPGSGGRLGVEVPAALPAGSLWVTVLRDGSVVAGPGGESLERKSPEKLGGVSLPAGSYTVRFEYRRKPLHEIRSEIRPGRDTIVQPSRLQLAEIEYSAGEAAAQRGGPDEEGDTDVAHFRRTLTLDPDHVNAHLQMAVYGLLHGARSEVQEHLANVRRVSPDHPDLPKIEALLTRRGRGS